MQKDDRIKSAEAKADSTTKDENILSASNDAKPNVVGLPSSVPLISYFCPEQKKSCLEGLSKDEILGFMEIVRKQFFKGIKINIRYTELELPVAL